MTKTTLFRYLTREQVVPLTVCVLGLTFVLITGRLLQLTRYLFTSSLTVVDLAELMAFAIPKLILYALPMATLIGVLLAFVRLNNDNELIALRTAGVSFSQLLPSVLTVLMLTTVISYVNTIYLIPSSSHAFEKKLRSLGKASLPAFLKEGTFIDTVPKLVFFFRSVNSSDQSIEGVFVQDQRQPRIRIAIVAEHAQILYQKDQNHLIFKISDGIITRVTDDLKDAQAVSFKVYDLNLSLDDLLGNGNKGSKSRREMTIRELWRATSEKEVEGARNSMELHQRLALPLSCLFLGLLGPPLGAVFRQRGRMTGVNLGLAVFLIYYILLSAGKGLGENGLLPAGPAMWAPNAAALAASLYLWFKLQRETPFGLSTALGQLRARLARHRLERHRPSES